MKILALGDTHGRDIWKEIVANETFDKVIFIGDYFDSWGLKFENQYQNFLDILEYKKQNIDKVVLLVGNHDYHYMDGVYETYSGYQTKYRNVIQELLEETLDKGLMQMCTIDDRVIYTHAGVTKTWCELKHIDITNLEGSINKCFMFTPQEFRFNGSDGSGDDITQSPIWVRPRSLVMDAVEGFDQVVGHTTQDRITTLPTHNLDKIHFIDVLNTSKEYLLVTDGIAVPKKYVGVPEVS